MIDIQQNLLRIGNEITQISKELNTSPEAVTLVAVSKTQPLDLIAEAYQHGQRDFAENYVQEAVEKIHNWNDSLEYELDPIVWHYIGKIQSNKCLTISQNFDWVHSLASIKHAKRLNEFRQADRAPLNICVQVQIEKEPHRNGIGLEELNDFLHSVSEFPRLKVRGIMSVLPKTWRDERANYGFNLIRNKYRELKNEHTELDTLSIGMSSDYKNALYCGSTMLRLGSSIFGPRNYNPV